MDASLQVIFSAVFFVVALFGAGAFARRLGWLTEAADRSLLNLTLKILVPCLSFDVIVGNRQMLNPANLVFPPLVGCGLTVLGLTVCGLAARWFGEPLGLDSQPKKRTFAFTAAIQNYGFIPIPLVEVLFRDHPHVRDSTMGVLLLHNIGVDITFWTVGVLFLSGAVDRGWWKRAINPASVTILASLAINAFCPDLPQLAFARKPIHTLGQAAVPMSLILVGATLADYVRGLGLRTGGRVIAAGALLRLGVLPAGMLLLAYCAPFSVELKRVIVIEAAMPSAMITIVMARHYHGDPPTALRIALGTTLLGLLTIPLWLLGGMRLLGL